MRKLDITLTAADAERVYQDTWAQFPSLRREAEQLAVLACERPGKKGKRPDCVCPPCESRRIIFKDNIGIQRQETRRAALQAGIIKSLREEVPK